MTDCCLGLVLLSGSVVYLNKIIHQSCLDSALILVHVVVSMNMLTDLSGLKTTLSDSQMSISSNLRGSSPAINGPVAGSAALRETCLEPEDGTGCLGKLLQEHRLL